MARKSYNFRFEEEFIRQVDEARGDVPRTRFVERALEAKLPKQDTPEAAAARRAAGIFTSSDIEASAEKVTRPIWETPAMRRARLNKK